MGCSHQTALHHYYAWRKSEDWHVLINFAKLPYHDRERFRFYGWWQDLCLQSKTVKAAHNEFVRQFKSGKLIPGMPTTQSRDNLPSGFDYNSLIRHAPKGWTIWQNESHNERPSAVNCDTKFEAISALREIVNSGGAITDIKFKGKALPASATLTLLSHAGLKIASSN
jgi:hypothetical protein